MTKYILDTKHNKYNNPNREPLYIWEHIKALSVFTLFFALLVVASAVL